MKRALIAALIAAGSAVADESPFLTGEALQAEVARNCADGCVVLSPTEAAALTLSIQAMVQEREQRAFEAGRKHEHASCRNRL
jgi:hypothetical protein